MRRQFVLLLAVGVVADDCEPQATVINGKLQFSFSEEEKDAMKVVKAGLLHSVKRSKLERTKETVAFGEFKDPSETVVIDGDRVIVDERFLHSSKHAGHVIFAKTALARHKFPHVVAYLFNSGTRGARACESGVPTVCMAKFAGYDQCGLLGPNVYFGPNMTEWDIRVKRKRKPVLERSDPRVFWRGNISERSCTKDSGNFARLQAVSLSYSRPELFDVKCIGCKPRTNLSECEHQRLYAEIEHYLPSQEVEMPGPSRFRELPRRYEFTDVMRHCVADPDATIVGDYVSKEEILDRQILLHLPGAFTGSYSRNLNDYWAVGAATLIWDAPYVEFYFPALKNGVTHLAVDSCNAESTVEALLQDPDRLESLAREAAKIGDVLLSADGLSTYYKYLLDTIYDNFPPLFPFFNKAAQDITTERNSYFQQRKNDTIGGDPPDCENLQLIEVLGARPHHDPYFRSLPAENLVTRRLSVAECEDLLVGGKEEDTPRWTRKKKSIKEDKLKSN